MENVYFETSIDALNYVMTLNQYRRHLSKSQLGMVAVEYDVLLFKLREEAEASKRVGSFKGGVTRATTAVRNESGEF